MKEPTAPLTTLVKKHQLDDPALQQLALIVRGADTDRFDLAAQSAGLWAISAGLSHNYKNDLEMLRIGMKLYDALYSWAKYVQDERHTWNPRLYMLVVISISMCTLKCGTLLKLF